jgi:hypothetical protein
MDRVKAGRQGLCALMFCWYAQAHGEAAASLPAPERQGLGDAWWTGPVLAASASTLPHGHYLIEPYFYDAITTGRFDQSGTLHSTPRADSFGSQTYLLYGVTDTFSAGLIPRFGYTRASEGLNSSGIGMGDLTVQGQYRLRQFREGSWLPTLSVLLAETFPTGKYDRLGSRTRDGLGSGARSTAVSVYSQTYFWLPNQRILRTRLDVTESWSESATVRDVSVYGTPSGFRGQARPGNTFVVDGAVEYSMTRNWVLALDIAYEHDAATGVSGTVIAGQGGGGPGTATPLQLRSNPSETLFAAPAVEYNWSARVGVIVGARLVPAGRNTTATVTPVAAINVVY